MISRTLANRILAILVLSVLRFSVFASGPTPTGVLMLAWDPSADPTVAGYRLYLGTESQVYTNVVDIGSQTTATVSSLAAGVTYYFAVTAYDLGGLESAFSGELSYTAPTSAPRPPYLQLSATISEGQAGPLALSGTAPVGSVCKILATQDFSTWSVVGTVTADALGFFQMTDQDSTFLSHRFYRIVLDPGSPPATKTGSDPPATTAARVKIL